MPLPKSVLTNTLKWSVVFASIIVLTARLGSLSELLFKEITLCIATSFESVLFIIIEFVHWSWTAWIFADANRKYFPATAGVNLYVDVLYA